MHALGRNFPVLYDFLHLGDDALGGRAHVQVEVLGGFIEYQVSRSICLLGLYNREISENCFLFDVSLALENLGGLRLAFDLYF